MGQIFLSYAREDRAPAERLARVLEGAGHSVWWDRRLEGGEEFGAEIEAALDASDVVVVAWSRDSIKSRWVRDEAAVGGDRACLVPVSLDGSLPPMGFRQFHTLDLAGWKGAKNDGRTAELLHSVERRAGAGGKAAPATVAAQPKPALAIRGRKPLWAVLAVLVLLIAVATAFFVTHREPIQGPVSKPTVALLPLVAAPGDPELRDIAGQARDSLARMLAQSGIPVRLLNAVPQNRAATGDFLISGELNRNAGKVVATVRLDEALHGVTVNTQQLEAAGDGIRDLPDRIGATMAGRLANGWVLLILDRRHPLDPSVIAELLSMPNGDELQSYQIAKRVAAQAPNAAPTQVALAFQTTFALGQLPRDERPAAVAAGRRAVERAIELAPQFGNTYVTWCGLHSETLIAQCEDQMRAGNRVDPDSTYVNGFLAGLMRGVGRFNEYAELTSLSYSHDPYDGVKISDMLRMLEFTGDTQRAHTLFEQAARWFPDDKVDMFRSRLFGLIYRADFAAMQRLEQEVTPDALPDGYTKSGAIAAAVKSRSQPALRSACASGQELVLKVRCMTGFAMVGDEDSAYAIADRLYPTRVGRTPAETEGIWLDEPDGAGPLGFITSPAAAGMRRDPRYLQLAQRTGLLDYWRSGRLPDFCRKQPEPICAQISRS